MVQLQIRLVIPYFQAIVLQKKGTLKDLVDPRLGTSYNEEEIEKVIRVALLCASPSPTLRPTMSEVVRLLQGDISTQEFNINPTIHDYELKLKALRKNHDDLYQDSGASLTRESDSSS